MMRAITSPAMGRDDSNGMIRGDGNGDGGRLLFFKGKKFAGGGSLGIIIVVSAASGFLSSFAGLFLFFHCFIWDNDKWLYHHYISGSSLSRWVLCLFFSLFIFFLFIGTLEGLWYHYFGKSLPPFWASVFGFQYTQTQHGKWRFLVCPRAVHGLYCGLRMGRVRTGTGHWDGYLLVSVLFWRELEVPKVPLTRLEQEWEGGW